VTITVTVLLVCGHPDSVLIDAEPVLERLSSGEGALLIVTVVNSKEDRFFVLPTTCCEVVPVSCSLECTPVLVVKMEEVAVRSFIKGADDR